MLSPNRNKKIRIILFAALLILIISVSAFVAYAMQSVSFPVEVKEPLQILNYPKGLSLYPGETINFNFTIQNHALVNYFQEFEFQINNTIYQKYVTFSNYNYSIPHGIHTLNAWFMISPNAPIGNFEITINKKIESQETTQIPTLEKLNNSSLNPSLELLAAGTRWTSPEGKTALYVNFKDNYETHSKTDGLSWEWWSLSSMSKYKDSVIAALEAADFEITLSGDMPEDLSDYDVVVIFAYYAVEPTHANLIRDYLHDGGSVVLIAGVPAYLAGYSKNLSCTTNLENIADWFGAKSYSNAFGDARVAADNPFGTSLKINQYLVTCGGSATFGGLNKKCQPIATYDSGNIFAFTHEYGLGRLYYQAIFKSIY